MDFRSLAGAVAFFACMTADAGEPLAFELKHSPPQELKALFDPISKQVRDSPLEITVDGKRVLVRGADEAMSARLSKLVAEFDVPRIPVITRFFKLNHASAEKAAEFLNKALAVQQATTNTGVQRTEDEVEDQGEGEDKPEEVPIQVVPAPRTNEVFAMGRAEDIKLVESLLRAIDSDPPPVFK